jgi:2-iminobutanoate/2-iminopropanoate deaminase
MERRAASSDQAPPALGPYSQAIRAGGFVFCSRTVGIDPTTGELASTIEGQTERALLNLAAILERAGSSLDNLVKTTIFYSDVEDFARINAVYERFMPTPPPARSAPANILLPKGIKISIEAIATAAES